ncbi:hypothetical protein HGRIS_012750 [Hohenbuehelia grisea]|uniref:WD40 repeat-like protein n=1 Tax=Hohenbuehelia grisea TaxID=104357 RepID=A0ABR3ITJ5_9AGAR
MLAIASTDALALTDSAALKRATDSIPAGFELEDSPTSCSWSANNDSLFFTSASGLKRYYPAQTLLEVIECPITPCSQIVTKDEHTLICAAERRIHVLDVGGKHAEAAVYQTFESHKSPVTSLSLSNDLSLLASTSCNAVHVHNLATGSHTVLRGLALGTQSIGACAFHPHSRTRLLLGFGQQFVMYDTTKPSSPVKTVQLPESTTGTVYAIACSPFSKTLVAVSTTTGHVGLIDLDKEKGLFRAIALDRSISCMTFSPEGATIYLGTDDGELLYIDLRALDKPPKVIIISEAKAPIVAITTQTKPKTAVEPAVKPAPQGRPSAVSAILSARSSANPLKRTDASTSPTTSPGRLPSSSSALKTRLSSARSSHQPSSPKSKFDKENKSSDPVPNLSGKGRTTLSAAGSARVLSKTHGSPKARSPQSASDKGKPTKRDPPSPSVKKVEPARKPRTLPTSLRPAANDPPSARPSLVAERRERPRTASSASRAESLSARVVSSSSSKTTNTSRPSSSASRPGTALSHHSGTDVPPVPPLPSQHQARRVSRQISLSRTPSPDLPDPIIEPITPVPQAKKGGTINVLRMESPEGERSEDDEETPGIFNKGKGKAVGLEDGMESDEDFEEEIQDLRDNQQKEGSLVVSPRRPPMMSANTWAPSPLRQQMPGSAMSESPAHDFLRNVVKDVMYDFDQERRSEMMGLHLDLVRMGRGWKKELRDLMQEFVGDLNDLREENRRLREENERLRRGY